MHIADRPQPHRPSAAVRNSTDQPDLRLSPVAGRQFSLQQCGTVSTLPKFPVLQIFRPSAHIEISPNGYASPVAHRGNMWTLELVAAADRLSNCDLLFSRSYEPTCQSPLSVHRVLIAQTYTTSIGSGCQYAYLPTLAKTPHANERSPKGPKGQRQIENLRTRPIALRTTRTARRPSGQSDRTAVESPLDSGRSKRLRAEDISPTKSRWETAHRSNGCL